MHLSSFPTTFPASIIVTHCKRHLLLLLFSPSIVKIPRLKSSKKLKSKAGVARHLNRPGTHGQLKSLETERSWSIVWWLQYAGRDRTLPVNPPRPGWSCGPNPGRRKPQKSSWSPESRERSAENGKNGKGLRICMTSESLPSQPQRRRADIRGTCACVNWV